MGNRDIEVAVFATPRESRAVLIPWLKQPDHAIQLVTDQRCQVVDVLLHPAAISMRNKQPPRPRASVNAREIHLQPRRQCRIRLNPLLHHIAIAGVALIDDCLSRDLTLICLGAKRHAALVKDKHIRSELMLPATCRQLATEIDLLSVAAPKNGIEPSRLLPRRSPDQHAKADGGGDCDPALMVGTRELRMQTGGGLASRHGVRLGELGKAGDRGIVGEGRHGRNRGIAGRVELQAL